ncbi:hypothetical protein NZD89_17125 [Alicyclobacillus fastidiosus]|uniref:CDP-alcohol phosphatidyltransferase family protein n=1 Tax=Alicyclobacillus fastidiosus TaxID=392011 RepID=A0ABY6ZD94_9BACL|nr:hypothetical protein [Alicyclobacillus fastidiosus]WAH40106.1 hypothetical protein NZD89_17125 [Alicyclobacillus fastidiosus]GMA61432.1 hypothetical protein GCM10025859_18720 [Alicyclobacillus fastidiosus]
MFGDWLDLLTTFVAILLAGATVKMMDDALDVEYDLCRGRRTLAARLGRASLPYSLLTFGLAMMANRDVALAVFLGSYAVGMFTRAEEFLPSRVPAYVEIVIAACLLVILVGWKDALWGMAAMSMIDWLDDVMDRRKDAISGQANVAIRFGLVETLVAILIVFCLALYAEVFWTMLALVALVILSIVFDVTTTKVLEPEEEEWEPWS